MNGGEDAHPSNPSSTFTECVRADYLTSDAKY